MQLFDLSGRDDEFDEQLSRLYFEALKGLVEFFPKVARIKERDVEESTNRGTKPSTRAPAELKTPTEDIKREKLLESLKNSESIDVILI